MIKKQALRFAILIALSIKLTYANAQDTTKNKPSVFNSDVYIYGSIDPLLVSSNILKLQSAAYFDKHIMAVGKVYGGAMTESTGVTTIYVGDNYPKQDFVVIIKKRNHAKFGHPETDLIGREIRVTGYLSNYKGMLAIKLSKPKDLEIMHLSSSH
ncbi:hypothetical protein [Mucilaginibacter flavus]|uniref:hypothetical protein n=1 Tax=Mucilaginibacter flavus TaxID=931504 RepID=UPI0025B524ED|nr:hypothetical protein [Mucilaginibacter flavus]MDN3580799.1 hypothetical protein [Mucilaginibacter flavus]